MAFKLTKTQLAKRTEIVKKLRAASESLTKAIEEVNDKLGELRAGLQDELYAYNEAVAEAKQFAEEVVSEADNDINDKSEKWQDSEAGQAAIEWKGAWESLELDEIALEIPVDVEAPELEHADELENALEDSTGG